MIIQVRIEREVFVKLSKFHIKFKNESKCAFKISSYGKSEANTLLR